MRRTCARTTGSAASAASSAACAAARDGSALVRTSAKVSLMAANSLGCVIATARHKAGESHGAPRAAWAVRAARLQR